MIFKGYYDWYNNHRKHGALGRKSPENYLRENDLISGPYKTEKKPILSQILTPFCPKIKGSIQ
jgi:putative transposase